MSSLNILAADKNVYRFLRGPEGWKTVGVDCYTPDTEVLTKEGWKTFDLVTKEDFVWQVDKDSLEGSWTHPTNVIWKDYQGDVYTFGNRRGSLTVTANHKMLFVGQKHKTRKDKEKQRWVTKACDGIPKTSYNLATCTTKKFSTTNFDPKDIHTAAMLQADSYYAKGRYNIQVSKPRKRSRVAELVGKPGKVYPVREHQTLEVEHWTKLNISNLLLSGKFFHTTRIGAQQIDILFDALSQWDGHIDKNGTLMYGTVCKEQAEEIQITFVRAGYEAKLNCRVNSSGNLFYTLSIRKKSRIRLRPEDVSKSHYEGKVGCVTVPKGFILVRREGQTFVSGNCNALEPHILAAFSQCPNYMALYGPNAVPNQDAYIKLGTTIPQFRDKFLEHYNPEAPTVEGVEFIKENYPNERFVCKVMFLSCVYGIRAPALREALAAGGVQLSMREVEALLQSYWRTFAAVKSFAQSLQKQWRDNGGYIISGRGTPRPLDQIGASKDILARFVSTTGHQYVMRWLYHINQIRAERGVTMRPLIADLHDATYWTAPADQAEAAGEVIQEGLTRLNEELQLSVKFKGKTKIGDNLEIAG
jgi:hypothetical protein